MGLLKYLAFFEFDLLKETGVPPLQLHYEAWKWGPVAEEIYSKFRANDKYQDDYIKIQHVKGNGVNAVELEIRILPNNNTFDTDYFTKDEIEELNRLIEIFADKMVSAKLMSDASHEEILSWKIAWSEKRKEMYLSDTFPNLDTKSVESLKFPEERFKGFLASEKILGSSTR